MSTDDPAAAGSEPTPEPSRLGGRYELGALLGHGGMAIVRLATDMRLGRTVAVKILRGELTEAPAFQARFRREARAAAALNHPAIVSVYDAGEETIDGVVTLYMVMEYVEGQTLRDLGQSGPQGHERALEITAAILDALEESHRAGIVHRDVKPANVMLTPTGGVKVMDFGVARAVADMSASLTQTSTVIGTAHYLSPEQARGEDVDARSDVYSTGCLLYELLTGRPPFQGDSAIAVAYQHVREAPRPPSEFEPSVPPHVDALVLTALAKQPAERYQSAAQMRSDILGVLAGQQTLSAMPVPLIEDTADIPVVADGVDQTAAFAGAPLAVDEDAAAATGRGRRRRRSLILMVAAAAVLVLALGGFALSGLGEDPTTGREPGPVRGGETSESPTPDGGSGAVAPADTFDSDPVEGTQDNAPAPERDPGPEQKTTIEQDPQQRAQREEPTPTQEPQQTSSPQPSQEPEPTPEPTPTQSSEPPPSESPEPTPTQSSEPSPTSAPQQNQTP
jgi:eukaryotic-like serine/threonine-protein kinase